MKSISLERKATLISTFVAALLILLKLLVGLYTGAISVVASAIDSLLDLGVSIFNYMAVRKKEEPPDEDHNFGHGKIEGIAAASQGLVILGAAFFILYQSLQKLLTPEQKGMQNTPLALGIMLVSFVITWILCSYLSKAAKVSKSLILEADSLHYRSDLLTNAAIAMGLFASYMTKISWVDPVLACLFGVYIGASSIKVIKKGVNMLMDTALPEEFAEKIRNVTLTHSSLVRGMHELKTRRSGNMNIVDLHLELNEEIPLGQAHLISDEIMEKIRQLDTEVKWMINIHLDPEDDSDQDVVQVVHSN